MENLVTQANLLNQLQHDINCIRTLMTEDYHKNAFEWVTNEAAMERLNMSPRTMQTLRDEGILGFSKVGNKIYYRHDDLDDMLRRHYHKPFRAAA